MGDWRIERLTRSHHRVDFCCGKQPLDDFLRSLVSQYERRNLGRTYVASEPGGSRVLGYYTLASGAVPFLSLPESETRKLTRHPVPVVLLARLAVDRSMQGRGLGAALLADALTRCCDLATSLGIHAIEVDAIDEGAVAFYAKYGFLSLLDDQHHLYLPVSSIHKALGGS